jgi:tetratricopeptide (TPR) repeat protein
VVKQSPKPIDTALISGLLAYRSGAFDEASDHLEPLTRNPDHAVASTAGFIHAMACFRRGLAEEARGVLAAARQELDLGLGPGLLGHRGALDFDYDLKWAEYARSLILRNEAEARIFNRVTSTPVNADTLRARRRTWQSMQALLDSANQHGKQRDWAKAREDLMLAVDQGQINWEKEGNLISGLPLKAAVVFALTGNANRYSDLCHMLVEPAAVSQSYYGRIALLWPEEETGGPVILQDLRSRAIEMARWDASRISEGERAASWNYRTWLNLGVAEYRAGNLSASLEALAKAREAFNLAVSGTAFTFLSMAAEAVGQTSESSDYFDQAEEHLEELLAGNHGSRPEYP